VIALDLLSTHPEYFSKAVLIATGDGPIGLPLYLKIFTWSYRFAFIWDFPVTCQVIFLYIEFFKQIDRKNLIAFSLAKYRPLYCWKAVEIYPTLLIHQRISRTGQKSLHFTQWKVFRNQRCNSFFLSQKRSTFISVFNIY
jgi:pimeloyl-ACP methyl ester carboxylesterase